MEKYRERKREEIEKKESERVSRPISALSVLAVLAVMTILFGKFSGDASVKTSATSNLVPKDAASVQGSILLKDVKMSKGVNSTLHELEKTVISLEVVVSGHSQVRDVYFVLTSLNSNNRNYLSGSQAGGRFSTELTFFAGSYEATFYATDQLGNQANPVKISFTVTPSGIVGFPGYSAPFSESASFNETGSSGNPGSDTG